MAKRSRKPLYLKSAASSNPGSIGEFAEAARVKVDRKPTISTPDFVNGLQDLGFTSVPIVMGVLQDLADAIDNLPAQTAFKTMTTQKSMCPDPTSASSVCNTEKLIDLRNRIHQHC
jgi:hypothetical protein